MQRNIKRERLLLWKKREENQCQQDYLMELAAINGYDGIRDLCRQFSISYPDLVSMDQQTITAFLRGEYIHTPKIKGLDRSWRFQHPWLDSSSRICPACLEEDSHIPRDFNSSLAIYCHQHQVHLIDRCPQCEQGLTYYRENRRYCNCGFDLRHSKQLAIQGWENMFYTFFAPWRISAGEALREIPVEQQELSSLKIFYALFNEGKNFQPMRLTINKVTHLQNLFIEIEEAIKKELHQRMDNMRIKKLMMVLNLLDTTSLPLLNKIAMELDFPIVIAKQHQEDELFSSTLPYARVIPPPHASLASWRKKTRQSKKAVARKVPNQCLPSIFG